ncbi:unnamed protein product [Leptidea sinapis]|uniref:Uncharacterized protein n=1 Tax=Leptidea sinapis TaxID=189913 RepID=A0A5E4QLY2_9NEOP|nr:unnamed protein product [Leptidea sinapis]
MDGLGLSCPYIPTRLKEEDLANQHRILFYVSTVTLLLFYSFEKKGETGNPDWSYSSIPKEISNHVNDFKRNMTECLKEVQANDKRTVKRLSPKTESPVHGECLIACVLKRNDNLMQLVSKFYGKEDKIMKKLEKNLDRCITKSIKNRDECVVAAQLNECTNGIMANNKHKITVNY